MPVFNKEIAKIEPFDGSLEYSFQTNYKILGIIREPYKPKGYVFKCEDCNTVCWAPKSTIKAGRLFCKCVKSYSPTEYEILSDIKSLCDIRKYIFNNIVGEFKGYKTKLNLTCPKHNHTWCTTTYDNFKRGVGCYYCGVESQTASRTYPDDLMVSSFNATGMFDAVFKKLYKDRWEIHCNICEHTYQASAYHLQEGKRGCKCSGQYKRSKAEFIRDINKSLRSVKSSLTYYKFVKDNPKTCVDSKVILVCEYCKELHERTINTVLARGCFCKCSRETHYTYISYIKDPDTDIVIGLKYGVESRYNSRAVQQDRKSPFKVERHITYRFENANSAYKAESALKEYFIQGYLSKKDFPDGFTETVIATCRNIDFIESIYQQYGGYEYYKE